MGFCLPKYVLVKTKNGLVSGLLTRFYTWRGDKPPEDTAGLTHIAESVSPYVSFVYTDKPHPNVPPEYFMIEWRGFLKVEKPGRYMFYVISSDGCKLWVNRELIINEWYDQPSRLHLSREIKLLKGFYQIKLLYYNRFKFGEVSLGWVTPEGDSETIPSNCFYFAVSNKVFFTGLPDRYKIVAKPVGSEWIYQCLFTQGVCMISDLEGDMPIPVNISIYNPENTLIYSTTAPLEIWGGDEYLVKEG